MGPAFAGTTKSKKRRVQKPAIIVLRPLSALILRTHAERAASRRRSGLGHSATLEKKSLRFVRQFFTAFAGRASRIRLPMWPSVANSIMFDHSENHPREPHMTSKNTSLVKAVAGEELQVLERLAEGVSQQVRDLSRTRRFDGRIDNTELALHEQKYAQCKAYEELAAACYGRTVLGTEIDEKDRPKAAFSYRITQANVGYVDGNCIVLARNSPLASALVTALPGDTREVSTRTKERLFEVSEARTFDGPVNLLSPTQKPNFRSASIRKAEFRTPVTFKDLRSAAGILAPTEEVREPAPTPKAPSHPDNPGWLVDWSAVSLGEGDELSLGHQFFTQTSTDQERALNNPFGLTFVEGIAGSGKTSVALGRLKFFANFGTGVDREYYGLQNASEKDFSPIGMVGFVLSPSLKRYLRDTASMLGLERLPIRDFEEFRIECCGKFEIAERFKRKKDGPSPIRTRLNWLRALDAALARAAAHRLKENLACAKSVPPLVAEAVSKIAAGLARAEINQAGSNVYHLDGLAQQIIEAVADAELRTKETEVRNTFRIRQTIRDERYEREKASLEREMKALEAVAEKRNISALGYALLSGISAHELILPAISLAEFPALVLRSFQQTILSADAINTAMMDFRQLFEVGSGRPGLPDIDLVNLVIAAAMIAEGFDYIDQRKELKYLQRIREYTAVFIDEVQDFDEVEVFLMGMSARSAYNQVTLSGDRRQRLGATGAQSYGDLFPKIPRGQRNRDFFLDYNFRQREELATFSAGFRHLIQGDDRPAAEKLFSPVVLHQYSAPEQLAEFLFGEIRGIPRNASIAVITPDLQSAEVWFRLMEEELGAYHRPPRLSRRDDLTRRVNVHFVEVRETKGLEFDVAIVPDLTAFQLHTEVGRNQAYVAISRPRHALLLACPREVELPAEFKKLQTAGLLRAKVLLSH